jgi:glycosyltransferase involved in cell wall biosynthesis
MRLSRGADATARQRVTREKRVLYTVTDPITALGFMRGQLSFLRSHGYDVHLATRASPELERFAVEEGVTLHDVPLSRTWLTREDLTSLRRARRVLREFRPDVLVYSTPKASLVWALASWLHRPSAVVYLLRGLRLESERKRGPGMALLWLCEVVSARTADLVLCVSESLRERALELRLMRPGRADVLGHGSSNGVDVHRFGSDAARRADMRESLGYTDEDVVVGFVGRLTEDKGVPELVEALPRCGPHVKALLVGPTERRVDEEELLDKGAGRLLHVEMTAHVEAYYDAMDILVLPSWGEGMPNVLLEAQAMGLPCITTTATGCRDAVLPNVSALLVKPRAPHELARVIDRLATHPEKRERMGRAGREHVVASFEPAQVWARYVLLFERLLAARGGPERHRPHRHAAPRARSGSVLGIPRQRTADHEREVV